MKSETKKIFMVAMSFFLLCFNILPTISFAEESQLPPEKPYEKIVSKNGNWYSEQMKSDSNANLIISYIGEDSDSAKNIEFKLSEDIILTGFYLPYTKGNSIATLQIKSKNGDAYTGFTSSVVEEKMTKYESAEGKRLLAGNYTAEFSPNTNISEDFLIKGYNADGYEEYLEKYSEWYKENSPDGIVADNFVIGSTENDVTDIANATAKLPSVFELPADYIVNKILMNTFNGGKGAEPGTVNILDSVGGVIATMKAKGEKFDNTKNGVWVVEPQLLLPAGVYRIALSEPNVLSYDANGKPMFFVSASEYIPARTDFSGTYKIDVKAVNTSTISGIKKPPFELKNFELTVLDYAEYAEIIGKYEGMPFSQRVDYKEVGMDYVTGGFNFEPEIAKMLGELSINVPSVSFEVQKKGEPLITMTGKAIYSRKDKTGGDYNTYDISVKGVRVTEDLPLFVVTAIQNQNKGGAGNVPGPDNSGQAAVGMLFPPLAGVVANVISELLKKSLEKKKKTKVVRDKGWYKAQNPNASDESIAMAMLADAMGSTDEPDEGDTVSEGDNESGSSEEGSSEEGSSEEGSSEEGNTEEGSSEEGNSEEENTEEEITEEEPEPEEPEEEAPKDNATEEDTTKKKDTKGKESETTEEKTKEEEPKKESPPEATEMEITDPLTGRKVTYTKDATTGDWVNPETGGVFDEALYGEAQRNAEAYKAAVEAHRADNAKPDSHMAEAMAKIKKDQEDAAYRESIYKKYGTNDKETLDKIINEQKDRDQANADKWNTIGDICRAGEVTATVAGAAADSAVDLYGNVNPAFAMKYKAVKNMVGTVADKGFSTGSIAEGAIKGAADAATVKFGDNPLTKAVLTIGGESIGSGVGAGLRGEDGGFRKAAENGFVEGCLSAATGAVMDKATGNLPKFGVNGNANVSSVTVSKLFGTKHGALQNTIVNSGKELVIKPMLDPFKSA